MVEQNLHPEQSGSDSMKADALLVSTLIQGHSMDALHQQEPNSQHIEYGPIGKDQYKEGARKLVEDGFADGSLDAKDRERMWTNFTKLEELVAKKIEEAGSTGVDIITILEESIWQLRGEAGTAYTENDTLVPWADYVRRNKAKELQKSPALALDDHHLEVEEYSSELITTLIKNAQETGVKLPLDEAKLRLIPSLMRFHDTFKWIAKFGTKDSIPADHEEQVRYFVNKYFLNQHVNGVLVTQELATWMANALGNHENIYEEEAWSKERSGDSEQGNTISLMFIIDTMTNAVKINTVDGTRTVHIDKQNFSRFTSLAERHLKLFLGDEPVPPEDKNFGIAKAYRPQWILKSSLDFVDIMTSWTDKYGVKVGSDVIVDVIDECRKVFEHARAALKTVEDKVEKSEKLSAIAFTIDALEKRRASLSGENMEEAPNVVFYENIVDVMRDRFALVDLAQDNAEGFAEDNNLDPKDVMMTEDEKQLIVAGPDSWKSLVRKEDKAVEAFAQNSVGFIELMRLIALMESTATSQMTLQEMVEYLSRNPAELAQGSMDLMQTGARGAHSGWFASALILGKEDVAAQSQFDSRDILIASSDWLQIRTAASFLKEYMAENNIETVSAMLELFKNREFMFDCAVACDGAYKKTMIERLRSEGRQIPDWLKSPMIDPAFEADVRGGKIKGLDGANEVNIAREKYADNTVALATIQEEIPNIIRRRKEMNRSVTTSPKLSLKAEDVLNEIITNKISDDERKYLTSSQKAAYLVIQVFKGRAFDTSRPINLASMAEKTASPEGSVDWKQLQKAAVHIAARIQKTAYESLSETVDLSPEKTMGRPAMVVDKNASREQLAAACKELGIVQPDHIIMFSGGAVFMEGGVNLDEFKAVMIQRIGELVKQGKRVLIVTGGTDSGFMKIAGEVSQEIFANDARAKVLVQVLGVSPKDMITFDANEASDYGPYLAATGHTAHIEVDTRVTGRSVSYDVTDIFGDETNMIEDIFAEFGKDGVVKDAVVGNGGVGTALEIRALLEQDFPVLLVKDSYRMATLVGQALVSSTYADYVANVTTATAEVSGENPSLAKAKKRTLAEINNIFALLKAGDEGVETRISSKYVKEPVASEVNFQIVKQLLSRGVVKYVDSPAIGTYLDEHVQKNNVTGIVASMRAFFRRRK